MKLPDFLDALDRHPGMVPIDELVTLLKGLNLSVDDVRGKVSFVDKGYARNLLKVGPGYVALILCWKPGQASSIHDHHGSSCGVLVLKGTVTETKYERDASGHVHPVKTTRLPTGHVCGSFDSDIHCIRNAHAETPLVTLHVYTPIMQGVHMYREGSTEVTLWDDDLALDARRSLGLTGARA